MLQLDAERAPRVLVVDDEEQNVTLLVRLLDRIGIDDVEGVTDSSLVMHRIEVFSPDIVLLDLHMPDPDGFEILEMIGALDLGTSYLPVIVLTADVTDEAKQRALSAGAADFLTKPFGLAETALRVKNHIRTRQLHEQVRHHAAIANARLEEVAGQEEARLARLRSVTRLVDRIDDALTMVFQPIVDLQTGATIGAEALSRFDVEPERPIGDWFVDAVEAGVGLQLELAAVRRAISHAEELPDGVFVSFNVSAATFRAPAFGDIIRAGAARPIVIELTEYEKVDDYQVIVESMASHRKAGARLAIDDAGSGFASLQHILKLQPDLIKLDLQLVAGIDVDPAKRSLASALVRFASETGASLIAEGIETEGELAALRELGVTIGQGYALGKPGPLPLPAGS